jgi:hypothetical protein
VGLSGVLRRPIETTNDSGIRIEDGQSHSQNACARVEILLIGTIFDGSSGSFGWDGNCKVEPPLSFDVVLFGPLESEISQINLMVFVQNSPIGQNSSIFRFVNYLIFSDLQLATGLHC